MFNMFRHCRKDEISFDIVAETGNIVAKNGKNVEATFDTVERIVQLVAFDTVERIVQLVAFNNVASTLLLVWTGLNRVETASINRTVQAQTENFSVCFTLRTI